MIYVMESSIKIVNERFNFNRIYVLGRFDSIDFNFDRKYWCIRFRVSEDEEYIFDEGINRFMFYLKVIID